MQWLEVWLTFLQAHLRSRASLAMDKRQDEKPGPELKKRWVNECTNARGVIDFYGLIERAVPYCLTGWSDNAVVDAENKPIQFNTEIALLLPEDFYTTFSSQLGLSNPDSDQTNGSLKNSKST